jgi:hypothetical protein
LIHTHISLDIPLDVFPVPAKMFYWTAKGGWNLMELNANTPGKQYKKLLKIAHL